MRAANSSPLTAKSPRTSPATPQACPAAPRNSRSAGRNSARRRATLAGRREVVCTGADDTSRSRCLCRGGSSADRDGRAETLLHADRDSARPASKRRPGPGGAIHHPPVDRVRHQPTHSCLRRATNSRPQAERPWPAAEPMNTALCRSWCESMAPGATRVCAGDIGGRYGPISAANSPGARSATHLPSRRFFKDRLQVLGGRAAPGRAAPAAASRSG